MVAIVGRLIAAAAGALVGAAVSKELDKPAEQREWHGEVGGVPYDFRRPTAEKLRRSAWDPDNPAVFVPHAYGVGWSVNFARVAEWIQPSPQPEVRSEATPELVAAPVPPALPAPDRAAAGTPVPPAAAAGTPVPPAAAADTPATPTGPIDATGDSQG